MPRPFRLSAMVGARDPSEPFLDRPPNWTVTMELLLEDFAELLVSAQDSQGIDFS